MSYTKIRSIMKQPQSLWLLTTVLFIACGPAHEHAEEQETAVTGTVIQTQEIQYTVDGQKFIGWLAWDSASKEKHPGVLVVHEWWGHNDYARHRAEMLAELGYTALAVDMFGDGKQAGHPDEAMAFVQQALANAEGAKARFEKALAIVQNHPTVDPTKTAAIGYCFGGSVVLEMARGGVDLDGVVSFHGGLGTEHPADSSMKSRILVCTGADDPMVPDEAIAAFDEEMKAAGAQYEIIGYPGAKHAFTNPAADSLGKRFELPLAYHAQADTASWDSAKAFLSDLFN
jgi:dienelactone hydrolase